MVEYLLAYGQYYSTFYFPSAFKILIFSPKNNLGNMKQKVYKKNREYLPR